MALVVLVNSEVGERAVAQAQTTSTAAARMKPSVILGVVGLARLGRLRRGAAGPAAPRGAFVEGGRTRFT
jgi:hypothetical protein